jgi:diguanylate cyclase (GGDEF)-like protein
MTVLSSHYRNTERGRKFLASWERATADFLRLLHLESIKSKIIAFALLTTFIPSLTMGWLSYIKNRQFLNEKISQELLNVTSQASREFDVWFKERFYEVKVFSSSYVVPENLTKISLVKSSTKENRNSLTRVRDYLKSLKAKFSVYEELLVLDGRGQVVATTSNKKTDVRLPQEWLKTAKDGTPFFGEPMWDTTTGKGIMVIAQPILTGRERLLGVLAAKLNFQSVVGVLENYSLEDGELYLVTREGAVFTTSTPIASDFMETSLGKSYIQKLFSRESASHDYVNYRGRDVMGTLKKIPPLSWGLVVEKDKEKAYAKIIRLRNLTIGLVAVLLCVIGLAAYLLGLTIVSPLNRLIGGADKVARGDLEVDLPVHGGGELAFMTRVFNNMVHRLRQGREELAKVNTTLRKRNKKLQELSVTDSLTGLHNHKHLMDKLASEVTRSERHDHPFSVVMIDIDYFKKYNDTYGHQAGDDVLRKMANIFKESIRSSDYVARYGGEEFTVVFPETGMEEAMNGAKRIRKRLARETFGNEKTKIPITISMGIATYPDHGEDPETLVSRADAALYQAKKTGRNRVVRARQTARRRGKKIYMRN